MLKQSLLARNVVTNLASFVLGIAIAFFISPYLIRTLGDARYGAWALIAELLGYYGLLDLGIRSAVIYHVVGYLARNQTDQAVHLITSAFWTLALLGSAAAAGGIGLAYAFPHLFVQGDVASHEILTAMVILACAIGLSLPMEVFSAALVAQQRLDIVNAIDAGTKLLVAAGIFVVLGSGGGLVALSALQAGGKVLGWLCTYLFLRRRIKPLSLHPTLFRMSELKALTHIGSQTFVINVAQTILQRTDLVLIGILMEVKWVTYFTIGRMLVLYTESAVSEITRAYTPRLAELYAKKDPDLNRVFLLGTRLSAVVAIVAICGVWSFADVFLRLWVGPDYVTGPLTLRSDVVAFLLGAAYLPRITQSISRQLIFASGRLRFLMYLTVAEALLNIVLSIALVGRYGLAGVAWGTLVPLVIGETIALPWFMSRGLRFSQLQWLTRGLAWPIVVGVLSFALGQLLRWVYAPATWASFLAEVLIVCVVALALSVTMVLGAEERSSFLQRIWAG